MTALRRISDAERRGRIGVRHALAPAHRLDAVASVTRAMTVLHATEAATVHLAVAARSEGLTPGNVDAALYESREVVKQLAMRRTLFVFPRDLLPAAWGSASARVATSERKRIAKAIEGAGLAADGRTNREIAQELFVTPKTVEVHLSSAYRKLGIASRRELAGSLTP